MASKTQRHRVWRLSFALLGATTLALSAAACKGGDSTTTDKLNTPECAAFKEFTGIAGKKVTIYASIRDVEQDLLKQSWKDFENCTGVKIDYEGSGEFETQIKVRV
ncbi:MAG TPA: sugar ABC transporter substrate-binding protein, partial [Micromonosporaceae bacterium]|nr:sugar ABC transporter substrate-binding protein [Micromonosporaceae bacterium]